MSTHANHSLSTDRHPATVILLICGLLGILFRLLIPGANLDPDLFHEMCLARATLQLGHIPLHDLFAYTPTVYPVIHHEWGSGMIFYFLMTRFGPGGLMALRLVLIGVLLTTLVIVARRRGAGWLPIFFTLPVALIMLAIGFGTIRAQLFTMVFTSLLLLILNLAETRSIRWLFIWPVVHVIWLNLHGGFVVGLGIIFLYTVERSVRQRQVQWAYVIVWVLCLLLMLANPYGFAYLPFLWNSLTLSRPLITEWKPLWASPIFLSCYLLLFMLLVYCIVILGPRKMTNLVILLVGAALAMRHIRHVSLFAILCVALLPAYIQATPLCLMMERIWRDWSRSLAVLYAVAGVACVACSLPVLPWIPHLPGAIDDQQSGDRLIYPAGVASYLRTQHVKANVLAPFELGAYLSWRLDPDIKVAVDGRYEVAYPPNQVEEFIRFYQAGPKWQETLQRYPPDLVLMPKDRAVASKFAQLSGWKPVYQDALFVLYARM